MQVLVAFVAGLVLWLVMWAVLGTKPFDGFLPTIGFVLIAVIARLAAPVIKEYIRP